MKIHLMVERDPESSDSPWVNDAVDEYTLEEWNGRYPDEFQAKLDANPKDRAVLIVEIPEGALEQCFPYPPVVQGRIE